MFQCCIIFWRIWFDVTRRVTILVKVACYPQRLIHGCFFFCNLCSQITEYFSKLHHSHLLKKPFHFAIRELLYYPKILDNVSIIERIKLSSSGSFFIETVFQSAEDEVLLQCNIIQYMLLWWVQNFVELKQIGSF